MSSMAHVINGVLRKDKELQEGIESCQTRSVASASRLKPGGIFDELIDQETMQEYREQLKKIGLQNVEHGRQLQAYMNTMKSLGNGSDINVADDIQAKINKEKKAERAKLDEASCKPEDEDKYKELCKAMGEGEMDDDEIEMVDDDNIESLKCPLTRTLMEDPVKNTKCGHLYSKEGITFHLRNSRECPIAGCNNIHVSLSQLQPHELTALKVRQAKKRIKREEQARSQDAEDFDDDDDE